MWVQACERKHLWVLALRTKLKKGFLFRKITSQNRHVVSECACASSSVRGTAVDPGLALHRLRRTDTFLHIAAQNSLGLHCGCSLPTFLHGTEPCCCCLPLIHLRVRELNSSSTRDNLPNSPSQKVVVVLF